MMAMQIPINEQIDAILTGRVWNIVRRYCDGRWGDLVREWTVSVSDIRSEAERRGLECFVTDRPRAEGNWLCSVVQGFEVFYFERGVRMDREVFATLPEAFDAWLTRELKSLQLPRN